MTIFNNTTIHLSPGDALRVLLGKPIRLATQIEVATEVEVLGSQQQVQVEPLFAVKKQDGSTAQACA